MGPVASRGQKISLRGVHVLNLRDGLIQRSEDYWDAATFQRQLNNG
jgi:ketosteroid isomerase-like protein